MKPPYHVPTMAEIAAVEANGFRAVSTFAGCGGSSLGYRMAGFKMLWASEFVDAAREVYTANAAPGTVVDGRDIREVDPEEVLKKLGLRPGELDVLDGSPPCASFSTAGKRDKHWGQEKRYSDKVQRTDDLFFEYVRFVRAMRPKVFVAENVSGLVKGVAKGYFIEIIRALAGCGYAVEARLLDAQWLGVPQARQRIIFVGVRDDLGIAPAFPKPLGYRYSLREVLEVEAPVEPETDIAEYAISAEHDRLNPGQSSSKYFNLVKPDADEPCPTVTALGGANSGVAAVTHPTERRKFSIAELKQICSFPQDFILSGTFAQQWERLGRAVPPLMMKSIALAVKGILECAREKGSGRKLTGEGRTNAGRGSHLLAGEDTATSGSITRASSSRRTSTRSKKKSGGV